MVRGKAVNIIKKSIEAASSTIYGFDCLKFVLTLNFIKLSQNELIIFILVDFLSSLDF